MTKRASQALILVGAALTAVHCYPVGYEYTDELDTVVTWKNSEADYTQLRTYDIAPDVVDLCQRRGEGGAGGFGSELPDGLGGADTSDCYEVSHEYDQDILDAVERNMEALGYTRVPVTQTEKPDVMVVSGIVAGEAWIIYQYYPWCWYYPYYSWYCGYYPPGGTVGLSYPTGTIVMSMVPTADPEEGEEPPRTLWVGGTHGLSYTGESNSSIRSRINQNIDQAFAQSPYLEVSAQ